MDWVQPFFQKYPELAVYLALGVGYAIGGVKLGGFSLGGSTGSLLAGLLIGALLETPVAATAKSVLFMLFLFGIGYSVGPKFAKAMKGDGWRFAVLGVFVPVVGLLTAWGVAAYLRLDPGFAGGLVSGALTESPAIGTASEAIEGLAISAEEQQRLDGSRRRRRCAVLRLRRVRRDLGVRQPGPAAVEARSAQGGRSNSSSSSGSSATGPARPRAGGHSRCVPTASRPKPKAWSTVAALDKSALPARLYVVRLRRDEQLLEGEPSLELRAGDVVAVSGPRETLVDLAAKGLVEVEDRELLDLTVAAYDVFLTAKDLDGQSRRGDRQARTGSAGRLPAQDRPQRTGRADRPGHRARAR